MIAIVHSIYSQSVHALALKAGLMGNDAERYCRRRDIKPRFYGGFLIATSILLLSLVSTPGHILVDIQCI